MKRTTLSITIEGMNVMNEYSKKLVNHLIPELNTLIGKKVFLSNGSKSAKFQVSGFEHPDTSETIPDKKHTSFQYWINQRVNAMYANVKICINGGSYDVQPNTAYCQYFNRSIYLGETDGQTLLSVTTLEKCIDSWGLNRVFTEEQIKEDIKAYEASKEITRNLFNAIPYEISTALSISR